jgi:pyridoxamine 5'-phosphate oxidase
MELQDYFVFAKENPLCSLATLDGDQPRVRTFWFWFADESGFYFETLAMKEVFKQLQKHPKVEVCFFNNATEPDEWKSMRVTGKVEILDDIELKKKLFVDLPMLQNFGKPEDPVFHIFRIYTGEVHFWKLANAGQEQGIERIKF